jgi:hypothetical protein
MVVKFNGCNAPDSRRQNRPVRMQQFLKALVGSARARIFPAELFDELLIAVHDTRAALHMCFRWESAPALTGALESRGDRDTDRDGVAWCTSGKGRSDTRGLKRNQHKLR